MKLTIDGKKIEAEGKKSILDAARENDIFIPALCDHPILGPFSGCRLCIVEIEGRRGFAPSCSTYIEDGMEVRSDTPPLRQARKEILGLILTEHPDACLVCTEKKNCDEFKSTIRKVGEVTGCVLCSNNGRCDLQDVVEAVQLDKVSFPSVYRDLEVKKSDPFFDRNYNLCILCGRCVRVCHELRGASTVHFVNRGSEAAIGTVLDRPLVESGCQFCGACVDVCPTGALTERAIKYERLPDSSGKTICPLCSVGCELDVMLDGGKIRHTKPSDGGLVNGGQACVKGRFLIRDVVYSMKRVLRPLVRRDKELEEVSWDEALDFAAKRIKEYRAKEIGILSSPHLSCEDHFAAQKFAEEVIKTPNFTVTAGFSPLDSVRDLALKHGISPSLHFKKEDISRARVLVLAGTDLAISHPILWLEVLKAVRNGAELLIVSPFAVSGRRHASWELLVEPGSEDLLFRYLAKIIQKKGNGSGADLEGYQAFKRSLDKLSLSKVVDTIGVDEEALGLAAGLLMQGEPCFIAGMGLTAASGENKNMAALWNLSLMCRGKLIALVPENNRKGIFEIEQTGRSKTKPVSQIIQAAQERKIKAIYAIGPVPLEEKTKADFLLVQDSYLSDAAEKADVVLPAATFAETDGTFVNVEGRVQPSSNVIGLVGESKPDWWILDQLAKKIGNKNFAYKNSRDVLKDVKNAVPAFKKKSLANIKKEKKEEPKFVPLKPLKDEPEDRKKFPFLLCSDYSLDTYRNLILSEEARGFEMIRNSRWIKINPQDAKRLKIENGEAVIAESTQGKRAGEAKITDEVPKGVVKTCFLWRERAEEFRYPIPVKIKRGK